MRDKLHLLKIGGKVLTQAELFEPLLRHWLDLPGKQVLVHGGGKRAGELGATMGFPARMIDGRRITDGVTLEIVTMVYAGLYNKQLVSRIQAMGGNALGLSGADGDLIRAGKRPVAAIDYGYVGDVKAVNRESLNRLLETGFIPVFCAITHDGKGQLLNTNADTVAGSLANDLAKDWEVHLYYCLEKPGVLENPEDDRSLIPFLAHSKYTALKEKGAIHSGMIPKLDNAFAALEAGVKSVVICGPDSFVRDSGTRLIP